MQVLEARYDFSHRIRPHPSRHRSNSRCLQFRRSQGIIPYRLGGPSIFQSSFGGTHKGLSDRSLVCSQHKCSMALQNGSPLAIPQHLKKMQPSAPGPQMRISSSGGMRRRYRPLIHNNINRHHLSRFSLNLNQTMLLQLSIRVPLLLPLSLSLSMLFQMALVVLPFPCRMSRYPKPTPLLPSPMCCQRCHHHYWPRVRVRCC